MDKRGIDLDRKVEIEKDKQNSRLSKDRKRQMLVSKGKVLMWIRRYIEI